MLPLIRRELVTRRNWLCDEEFLDVIGVAQCSPGPVAVNTAVFAGLKVLGYPGALVATLGTVLPSMVTLSIVAACFLNFRQVWWIDSFFRGVRPAVVALLVHAAYSLGSRVIKDRLSLSIMLGTLALSVLLHTHPVMLILLGGLSASLFHAYGTAHAGRSDG